MLKLLTSSSLATSIGTGGYFESTKYSYGPTSADFMLRDLFIDFYPIDGLWLRVGNQIIARGESNLLISSDIANPRDLSTIGLQDLMI